MNRPMIAGVMALCLLAPRAFGGANAQDSDATSLLRLMPADFPLSVVVVDSEKLDSSLSALNRRFGPVRIGIVHPSNWPGSDVRLIEFATGWVTLSKAIGRPSPTGNATPETPGAGPQ